MFVLRASCNWVTPRRAEIDIVTESHGDCCEYGTCDTPQELKGSRRTLTLCSGATHSEVVMDTYAILRGQLASLLTPSETVAYMHDANKGPWKLREWALDRETWGQETLDL